MTIRHPKHYPYGKNSPPKYMCFLCREYAAPVAQLKCHITSKHGPVWGEYLREHGIHRCNACDAPLSSLSTWYCDDTCRVADDDPIISCDGCGDALDNPEPSYGNGNRYCDEDCFYENDPHVNSKETYNAGDSE